MLWDQLLERGIRIAALIDAGLVQGICRVSLLTIKNNIGFPSHRHGHQLLIVNLNIAIRLFQTRLLKSNRLAALLLCKARELKMAQLLAIGAIIAYALYQQDSILGQNY
jgi:hypothetical protein